MTTPTNIIEFPGQRRRQPQTETANTSGAEYIAGLTSNTAAIEFAVGALVETDEDRALHVAAVVGASIRFARRRGISMASLPTQLRHWLVQECDRGDASAIMVREWLTGNARFVDLPELNGEGA
ncbi:hypothetical protein IFT66_08105 [Rhizobium sp. CFBP 13726]|uniref:hypothetical protein n=1 Tax=Rhizobium sp. CFBP 13726 TaxID=2775296 RepID=UPI000DE577A0|nr:hypothetical protein [Rhizobium sp. CFBP 13726]MBD8651038.1 hypothetical protein [Rhizobium sp. CFBP 13726]